MKNASLSIAAVLFFCFAAQTIASAQKTAIWKGGTPGKVADWTCASNWKEGRVPNEFSDVLIPNVSTANGFQPVVREQVAGVNTLTILPGATLRIESAGALEVFESLEIFADNAIQNHGRLEASTPENQDYDQRFATTGPMFGKHTRVRD